MAAFNPFTESFRVDPYPHFEELRREDPVHWSELGFWVLTRYRDIHDVLQDRSFGIAEEAATGRVGKDSVIGQISSHAFLFLNPPDHTRIRRIVGKAFTPRLVDSLEPRIVSTVRGLIDKWSAAGQFDLIPDFAYRLPIATICDLVGVPRSDRELIHEWSEKLAVVVDPVVPPDVMEAVDRAATEFSDYLRKLASTRVGTPRDDLISVLSASPELSEEELIATCVLLLIAGHDTTTGLIGNGMLALIRNPDQFRNIKSAKVSWERAVEEMLRFDSPVQVTFRWPTKDTEVGGKVLRSGDRVALLFGAANRDPAEFDEPNEFDTTRPRMDHLSFGAGTHFCVGAPLARLQARIAFRELSNRLDKFALAGDLAYRGTITLRTLSSLPLTFSKRARTRSSEPESVHVGR